MASDSLYHYTGIDAVASILKDRQLLLTNASYLNDSKELIEGLESIKLAIPSTVNSQSYTEAYKSILTKKLEDSISLLERELQDSLPAIFTCSFSAAYDDLSQWRAYGNYAIEFDPNVLTQTIEEFVTKECEGLKPAIELSKCIYSGQDKSREAAFCLTGMLREIPSCASAESLNIDLLSSYLLSSAASFKHSAFEQEQETRILASYVQLVDSNNKEQLTDYWQHWYTNDSNVNFRFPRNGYLVPRYALDIPITAIKSIQVGPMQDQLLAQKSLEHYTKQQLANYMQANSLTRSDFTHTIEITASSTPFKD